MKKCLLLTLIFLLSLAFISNAGFANDMIEKTEALMDKAELRERIWNDYIKLEEFQSHLADDPKDAEAMIDSIADHYLKIAYGDDLITPRSIAYISFPRFKQKNSYYCGPASALTAIYGMGKAHMVSGSTYNAKQDTLASNMGTNSNGTFVWRMRNELRKYGTYQYNYYYQPTKSNMRSIITGSLLTDNAPILHALTHHFSYYQGYSTGHYLTVVFRNTAAPDSYIGGMAVMDNHRDDSYYGVRDISLNEAYNAIRGRYLIGVNP